MYLIEVEFFSWYEIPDNIKSEYVKENYAVFRVKDWYDVQLFADESMAREEVKKFAIYEYNPYIMGNL